MQAWLFLGIAILFEVTGTTAMKFSEGLTKLWPTVIMFVCYIIAFSSLSLCLKKIPVSVAYAIWSAAGTAIIASIGILYFRESFSLFKALCLAMIVAGVVGLQMTTQS